MSSKRELVEAHSFSRRRLVTAFVSGAPGGREVEPVRPGRAIVGGVALSVLLIAGAVIAGIFAPRTPSDWRDAGVLVAEETGADYVVLEKGDPPRPVINTTSAQLIFGADLEPTQVSRSEIDQLEVGDDIGIFGAPVAPPAAESLVGSGWTACTSSRGGTTIRVGPDPGVTPLRNGAVVVRDEANRQWLVAGGPDGVHRMRLAERSAELLNRLRLGPETEYDVSNDWLNLVPEGTTLTASAFGVEGSGRPAYGDRLPDPSLRVGDLIEFEEQVYLLGADAPIALDPFAAEVYQAVTASGDPSQVESLDVSPDPLTGQTGWSAALPTPVPGEQGCLLLDAEPGQPAAVHLAGQPEEEAAAPEEGGTRTRVAAGAGAYVLAGSQGQAEGGQPWLIDATGRRYRLGGPRDEETGTYETAELLGYGSVEPPTIPDGWIERFTCGPELSRRAAIARPDPTDATRSCEP